MRLVIEQTAGTAAILAYMPPSELIAPTLHDHLVVRKCSIRRMTKKQKKLVEAGKGSRTDYFDVYGSQARAEVSFPPAEAKTKLQLQDIQGLVTWVLADGSMPQWVFVKNKPLVSKVVVLYLAGLDAGLYLSQQSLLHNLAACCGRPQAVMALSPIVDDKQTISALLTCPVKRKRKEPPTLDEVPGDSVSIRMSDVDSTSPKLDTTEVCPCKGEESISFSKPIARKPPFPALHYILTEREMIDHFYPGVSVNSESGDLPPGYVVTRKSCGAPNRSMVAVDCEMCYTAEGLELTRVSLVDEHGKVLLDKVVKPSNPITNYNTQWSGITAEMMVGVTTSLKDVQEEILGLVAAETILIGHSLESDLVALKVVHKRVIDTAILYPHPRGSLYKSALRTLAAKFLRRKIQDTSLGHNSIEDAQAAMDLVLLKIQNGPRFGEPSKSMFRESLISILSREKRQCSMIDRQQVVQRYAVESCHAIACTSDEEVLSKFEREVQKSSIHFLWAHLSDLYKYYEDRSLDPDSLAALAAQQTAFMTCGTESKENEILLPPVSEGLKAVLSKMNQRVKRVHDALPTNAMMIIVTGHGDTASTRRLQQLKWMKAASEAVVASTGSGQTFDTILEDFQARAETGLGFVCIKT